MFYGIHNKQRTKENFQWKGTGRIQRHDLNDHNSVINTK